MSITVKAMDQFDAGRQEATLARHCSETPELTQLAAAQCQISLAAMDLGNAAVASLLILIECGLAWQHLGSEHAGRGRPDAL